MRLCSVHLSGSNNMNHARQWLVGFVSLLIALGPILGNHPAFAQTNSLPEEYATLSANELDALVAPIALYPDGLTAQVLGAATWPDQVVAANQWLKVNRDLKGDALRQQVETRGWDPAVQALTQFPSVLELLANNIAWTSSLGDAAVNQQADVLDAIQRMRGRAYAAGTLRSGSEITVIQKSPVLILIEPAKPTVVYVPTYNPTVVYGAPVVVPGYTSSEVAAAAAITFGVGILVGAAVSSGSCGFGMTWGMGWNTASINCGGARYYGNPYWRGGYYPGYHPGYRPPVYYPPPRPLPPPGRPGGPARPTHPIERPPGSGTGARPGNPSQLPAPGTRPSTGRPQPGGPSNLPATGQGRPASPSNQPALGSGNRPSPSQRPNDRAMRGYGNQPSPAQRPNAFNGSGGGRQQSARGTHSMGGGRPAGGGRRQ